MPCLEREGEGGEIRGGGEIRRGGEIRGGSDVGGRSNSARSRRSRARQNTILKKIRERLGAGAGPLSRSEFRDHARVRLITRIQSAAR